MVRAIYDGQVLAESDDTVVVEGNHYFPPDSLTPGVLLDSPTRTLCFWKGQATYHSLAVGEGVVPDAAWSYPQPWPLARRIAGHVAFGPQVRVER